MKELVALTVEVIKKRIDELDDLARKYHWAYVEYEARLDELWWHVSRLADRISEEMFGKGSVDISVTTYPLRQVMDGISHKKNIFANKKRAPYSDQYDLD